MLKFFERELSQLEFTKRVVHQASDKKIPILERLKYLCIASANLDEFFAQFYRFQQNCQQNMLVEA